MDKNAPRIGIVALLSAARSTSLGKAPDMTNGIQSGIQFMKLVCHTIADQQARTARTANMARIKEAERLYRFGLGWTGARDGRGPSASQMRKANIAVCDSQQQKMFVQYII